ncbi:tetratricopeptide repeat protein [Flavobacterium sp. NRK1]|uniref:tetratricopeptide repeat protein n=1 Tax=Flavobacterium sp. NRK1 TaxID=2954929 RepID=UPI0020925741|nr:tetratricopeptide repeat protein [Flavobacterium sp. NRK1]MCO6149031.1 tetratricopeptide repeat protein [Flavobacterium sp. NRK1]
MKIKYAIAASLLLSIGAYAQKEELKALKKIDNKESQLTADDITEFKRLLTEVEPKMANATTEQQAEYNYYKGNYSFVEMMMNPASANSNFSQAIDSFNKVIELEKNGKKKYTEEIQRDILPEMKTAAVTMAQQLGENKMYKESARAYAAAYKVDPKDHILLYNAAAASVNAQDWDNALKYYLELDKTGFTNEGIVYTAKKKGNGSVEGFPNKETRDIAVRSGEYILPKDEKSPSIKGEIVKNIALIYNMKGDTEKAKAAFVNARKANPDDTGLIISEAELYLKTKDMAKYKELITEATQKSPNDAVLFFNLGVVSADTDTDEAIKYYKKALEINPNYIDAYINLGILMLKDEKKIVDEMNSLGASAKDNQRYDILKNQRNSLYNKALPYFENAHKIDPDNQDVISLLANVYQALDRQADYKAMKAKLK